MPQLLQFFRTFSGFVPLFKLVAMVFHKRVELGYLSASNEKAKFCANISFLCLLFKEESLLTSSTSFTRLVFAHCQGNVLVARQRTLSWRCLLRLLCIFSMSDTEILVFTQFPEEVMTSTNSRFFLLHQLQCHRQRVHCAFQRFQRRQWSKSSV